MDKSEKLFAINQTLPGLESFLREVLGNEGLSTEADKQRQKFLKRLEIISSPPSLPPRPPRLAARTQHYNESGSGDLETEDPFTNSHYRNDTIDDPVAFASHQRDISRHYTFSRGYVGRRELLAEDSLLYIPQTPAQATLLPGQRDSIKSNSSDEIYERLSIGEAAYLPDLKTGNISVEEQVSVNTTPAPNIGQRGATGRGSGGKGKLTTGWFKKEVKVHNDVFLSDIKDPVIQGYLRDMKSNKRRWCVLQGDKLYIFKTRDDPCMQIIDLPNCNIGVDDKKKISYSFSLRQTGVPLVQLAIEEGHDLSPWMSAIMAAVVRRSSTYRPTSPLEKAGSPGEAQEKAKSQYGYMRINIRGQDEEDGYESTYEVPIELLPEMFNSPEYKPTTSTPMPSSLLDTREQESYNPPLPAIPADSDSSFEISSEEEDDDRSITPQQYPTTSDRDENDVKRLSFHEDSHGTDSPSDHSTHRLSFGDNMASDEASEPKGERSASLLRKRTATVLSNVSLESVGSNQDLIAKSQHPPRKSSIISGPKIKRRRKQTSAESENRFLKDPSALHSGVLFQRRPLGVWSKRYCKLSEERLECYRHADDEKPSLSINLLGHDVSLIDSKESKKAYGFKICYSNEETFYFATDSRVAVERWIEVLSLASTGRKDFVAPFPPYYKSEVDMSASERTKSLDSLCLSEGVDSGDTIDFIDTSSCHTQTSGLDDYLYDDMSGFAADELDEDLSSDTREDSAVHSKNTTRRVKSPNRRSPRPHNNKGSGARERAMKRKNEKLKKNNQSGEDSPYALSPPQSVFISDSSGESKPDISAENRVQNTDPKKDKKGWAESLKLKQSRFARKPSLSAIITGSSPISEVSKNRLNTIKKTNVQSFAHLLSLFDKEGRFSGFMTELKVSKYSRTQLRRWCEVKNGALNLYNKQTEDTPAVKLNLAEMWLSDTVDESKHKYSLDLHDKDAKIYTFQVTSKEEFDKWSSVLRVFTGIRVEKPASTGDEWDKTNLQGDRTAALPKSGRTTKTKEEVTTGNTFAKRPSIRMKISQKVNVMDIFKRSQTYDFENPMTGDVIPTSDVEFTNFTGGQLTEVCVGDDHYTWSRARWCTMRDSELLIYADSDGGDLVKRIILYNVRIEEACDPDKDIYKFKVHKGGETTMLAASSREDYERWVNQLKIAAQTYGKDDHNSAKCRIPSPRGVFTHRRTRSENLPQLHTITTTSCTSDISTTSSPEKRLSQLSYGSASMSSSSDGSTDTLMNGHLQQMVPGGADGVTKWCAISSEYFCEHDSEDTLCPSRKWKLTEVKVKEERKGRVPDVVGFRLRCGGDTVIYQHENPEVISQWLSVLCRYCEPLKHTTPPLLCRSVSERTPPKKSLSDDNIKAPLPDQDRPRFLRKTLSEGKASGRRLLRKISEDNLLHKYRRADLFKAAWKGSWEKVNVKFRDNSPTITTRELERRFSCGSLFDSEGKFSGYLVELVTRPLCRSEVRRWCVVRDEWFSVYDQPRVENPRKVISMENAVLVNEGKMEESKFVFRLECNDESAVFRALSRTDFEKWMTAISVKIAVLKSRLKRSERRRGLVIDEDDEPSTQDTESSPPSLSYFRPSRIMSSRIMSASSLASSPTDSTDTPGLHRTSSSLSSDSVFMRERLTPTLNKVDESAGADEKHVDGKHENTNSDLLHHTRDDSMEGSSDIAHGMEKISLHDAPESSEPSSSVDPGHDVINLGSFQVPWSAVLEENSKEDFTEKDFAEPIYQNSPLSHESIEPIYQNALPSAGSSSTLSALQVEQIDLNSHEGRMNYRKFKEGFLANPEDSLFIDMLPKRSSEYDLGPLYDNLHFLRKHSSEEPHSKPVWTLRSSRDVDEVFTANKASSSSTSPNQVIEDRRSMASDYSGIVGESLLEEFGSISGSTSRSGTLSSQTSGADLRDSRAMEAAFDKEFLGDILGLSVTAEEAEKISEFCAQCDQECDQEYEDSTRSSTLTDRQSDTVTDRQSSTDVFFDAPSEFTQECPEQNTSSINGSGNHDGTATQPSREPATTHTSSGGGSGGGSVQDTYFGGSSSDEAYEDSSPGFMTAESSPCHKRLTDAVSQKYDDEAVYIELLGSVENTEEIPTGDRRSPGGSSEEEDFDTYFGKSPKASDSEDGDDNISSKQYDDTLRMLKEADDAILSVGAVLPSDYMTAQGISITEVSPYDTHKVVMRNKSSMVTDPVRQELTKSQAEFIRAVTEAFEGITNLSCDDNDDNEDTKL